MVNAEPVSTGGGVNRALRVAVPTALGVLRVVLGLAFPWLPVDWRVWAVAIAAASDFLDGWTARRLRAETDWGRLLDPVADKVFVLMAAGTLVVEGAIAPVWAATVATRDGVVLAGLAITVVRRDWAVGRRMRPSWPGKCATAAQLALLLVLVWSGSAGVWLLWLTAVLSVAAALDYVRLFANLRRSPPPDPAATSAG